LAVGDFPTFAAFESNYAQHKDTCHGRRIKSLLKNPLLSFSTFSGSNGTPFRKVIKQSVEESTKQ